VFLERTAPGSNDHAEGKKHNVLRPSNGSSKRGESRGGGVRAKGKFGPIVQKVESAVSPLGGIKNRSRKGTCERVGKRKGHRNLTTGKFACSRCTRNSIIHASQTVLSKVWGRVRVRQLGQKEKDTLCGGQTRSIGVFSRGVQEENCHGGNRRGP